VLHQSTLPLSGASLAVRKCSPMHMHTENHIIYTYRFSLFGSFLLHRITRRTASPQLPVLVMCTFESPSIFLCAIWKSSAASCSGTGVSVLAGIVTRSPGSSSLPLRWQRAVAPRGCYFPAVCQYTRSGLPAAIWQSVRDHSSGSHEEGTARQGRR